MHALSFQMFEVNGLTLEVKEERPDARASRMTPPVTRSIIPTLYCPPTTGGRRDCGRELLNIPEYPDMTCGTASARAPAIWPHSCDGTVSIG